MSECGNARSERVFETGGGLWAYLRGLGVDWETNIEPEAGVNVNKGLQHHEPSATGTGLFVFILVCKELNSSARTNVIYPVIQCLIPFPWANRSTVLSVTERHETPPVYCQYQYQY